jgi:acyl-CoA reductase-like NAD-dependent aldehyde dehydrogenase
MGSIGTTTGFDLFSGYYNTINGKLTSTEKTRHGINPATGKANPEVPVSTQKDVDDAVAAAKTAFKTWSKTPYAERKQAVLAYADALEQYVGDFGKLLTQEQGKPVSRQIARPERKFSDIGGRAGSIRSLRGPDGRPLDESAVQDRAQRGGCGRR